ncbi:hypothetical protein [Thermoactinospora rubra]|uniref:hypothetical protein n=1 Tax=Thermoactinospora rubra TaxID=1088767 RepID=UPI000A11F9F0|nr:hypothetical protein [Thermoactinospora rubra]
MKDHDVQALHDRDLVVYETVAAWAADDRPITVAELVRQTGLGEQPVRRSLETLVAQGRGFRAGGADLRHRVLTRGARGRGYNPNMSVSTAPWS